MHRMCALQLEQKSELQQLRRTKERSAGFTFNTCNSIEEFQALDESMEDPDVRRNMVRIFYAVTLKFFNFLECSKCNSIN